MGGGDRWVVDTCGWWRQVGGGHMWVVDTGGWWTQVGGGILGGWWNLRWRI